MVHKDQYQNQKQDQYHCNALQIVISDAFFLLPWIPPILLSSFMMIMSHQHLDSFTKTTKIGTGLYLASFKVVDTVTIVIHMVSVGCLKYT